MYQTGSCICICISWCSPQWIIHATVLQWKWNEVQTRYIDIGSICTILEPIWSTDHRRCDENPNMYNRLHLKLECLRYIPNVFGVLRPWQGVTQWISRVFLPSECSRNPSSHDPPRQISTQIRSTTYVHCIGEYGGALRGQDLWAFASGEYVSLAVNKNQRERPGKARKPRERLAIQVYTRSRLSYLWHIHSAGFHCGGALVPISYWV